MYDNRTTHPMCHAINDSSDVFDEEDTYPCFSLEEDIEDEDLDDVDMATADKDAYDIADHRDCLGKGSRHETNHGSDLAEYVLKDNAHSSSQNRVKRSRPRTITRSNTSPMLTMCRHSHSQLVVRCQAATHSPTRVASSCPAFFSPKWTEVVPSDCRVISSSTNEESTAQKRRYTIGAKTESFHRECRNDTSSRLEEDASKLGFLGRSRSYSDSDVQRLLMKSMSRELRKMGDLLNQSRAKRNLTPVNESAHEEDFPDDDDVFASKN